MLHILVMVLTINGVGNIYQLDSFRSPADCQRAIAKAVNARLYDGPGSRVTARFRCVVEDKR
jgi:hypothetical protein